MKLTLAIFLLLAVAGCANKMEEGQSVAVSRADFAKDGLEWPLTVDNGVLELLPDDSVVFHHGSKSYAVNALAEGHGYPKIDPIWADNDDGIKLNISPLVKVGLELGK